MSISVSKGLQGIGASAAFGSEIRNDKGQVLRGADHNRALLKKIAEARAESLGIRNDSTAVAIERALEERDSKIWEEERAVLTSAAFIPMDGSAGSFADAEFYRWHKKEMLGSALIKANLHGSNAEIPSVNANMKAQISDIWNVLSSYEVTVQEQLFAGRIDFNFGSEYAAECRKSIERAIDQALLLGDAGLGIEGFYNLSGVSVITPANNAWHDGGSTSDQILDGFEQVMSDIRDSVAASSVASALMPDTVIMSDRVHAYLSRVKTFGTASDRTMLSLLQERYPEITNWDFSYELREQGASAGLDRAVVYKKSTDYVKAAIPTPYQERPLIVQPYADVVHAYARFVPVVLHDARPMRYVDIDHTA